MVAWMCVCVCVCVCVIVCIYTIGVRLLGMHFQAEVERLVAEGLSVPPDLAELAASAGGGDHDTVFVEESTGEVA